jgi:hypothetical protein
LKYLELRERRQEESGDNGTKMMCITFNFHPIFNTCKNHVGDIGVCGIVLKWVVKERGAGT